MKNWKNKTKKGQRSYTGTYKLDHVTNSLNPSPHRDNLPFNTQGPSDQSSATSDVAATS